MEVSKMICITEFNWLKEWLTISSATCSTHLSPMLEGSLAILWIYTSSFTYPNWPHPVRIKQIKFIRRSKINLSQGLSTGATCHWRKSFLHNCAITLKESRRWNVLVKDQQYYSDSPVTQLISIRENLIFNLHPSDLVL